MLKLTRYQKNLKIKSNNDRILKNSIGVGTGELSQVGTLPGIRTL